MSTVLPNHLLKLVPPEIRATMGKAGMTAEEAEAACVAKNEKHMHEQFTRWLEFHRNDIYWDHARMDKATSNRVGHPDFVIQRGGKALNIELKMPGGKLRNNQKEVHEWLASAGAVVYTCYSAQEAIAITRKEFGL